MEQETGTAERNPRDATAIARSVGRSIFNGNEGSHFFNTSIDNVRSGMYPMESTAGLFEAMGYELDEGYTITGYPTPDTVVSSAKKFDIDVTFIEGAAVIPGQLYVDSFARGQYPVAVGDYDMYRHDIDDDHLSSMILGGAEVMGEVQRFAQAALAQGDTVISQAVKLIDLFTSQFRYCVADSDDQQSYPSTESDRMTDLYTISRSIGISDARLGELLVIAKGRAAELGMDVF